MALVKTDHIGVSTLSEKNGLFFELGFKVYALIAGFLGGAVNAILFAKSQTYGPMSIIGMVFVGAITANYLSESLAKVTGFTEIAVAFVIGMAAKPICERVIETVRDWKPFEKGQDKSPE